MIRSLLVAATVAVASQSCPAVAQSHDEALISPSFSLVEHRIGPSAPASVLPEQSGLAPPDAKLQSVPQPMLSRGGFARPAGREKFLTFVRAAELRHALPEGLLDALVAVESAYRPDIVSRAGAMGLAQLMPATARSLGVFDPFDPRANVDGGARFLRAMLDRFGSVALALAAYNAGPRAVIRAGGIPGNAETPGYVQKVLALWRMAPR